MGILARMHQKGAKLLGGTNSLEVRKCQNAQHIYGVRFAHPLLGGVSASSARSAQNLNRMLYPLSLWVNRKHPAKLITACKRGVRLWWVYKAHHLT